MYEFAVIAFAIEVNAQLLALKRSPFPEAVKVPPLEMVEVVKPVSLKLEVAVASLPAKPAKSKVKICPQEKLLTKRVIKSNFTFIIKNELSYSIRFHSNRHSFCNTKKGQELLGRKRDNKTTSKLLNYNGFALRNY